MNSEWIIKQKKYDIKENLKYETIFTLANGYRGFRGYNEFSLYNDKGNFIAGIFNRGKSEVTEIVNSFSPLDIKIYFDNKLFTLDTFNYKNFERILDMKNGILYTEVTAIISDESEVKIKSERFVSRSDFHRWGAKYTFISRNYKGKITVENIADGNVFNYKHDPYNKTAHIENIKISDINPGVSVRGFTTDKKTGLCESVMIYSETFGKRKYKELSISGSEIYDYLIKENEVSQFYEIGTTGTSKEYGKNFEEKTNENLKNFFYDGYENELKKHSTEMEKIWKISDIEIKGDKKAQIGIRFNIFHLFSCAYEDDSGISIAAKGLHGEGYKGHVFWDTEIFMLPFFTYTQTETARNLLLYRYNTLEGARKNASENGQKGARFPWESADEGTETTPKWGFDYLGNPVRIWTGDEEYHISSDIALAYWNYYRNTKDDDFMINYGAEIFFDTAVFWTSRLEWNNETKLYEINRVIGPDEFHEHVNNNFYTNYLAKWNLEKAYEIFMNMKEKNTEKLNSIMKKLNFTYDDVKIWKELSEKITVRKNENGVIEQFDGYFKLKDIKISEKDSNDMPIWPKGTDLDKLNETQLIKQPDVIMLLLILEDCFSEKSKKINYEYYEKRTMHKSSLSPSMYSVMGLKVGDTKNAYKYFMKTIYTDLEDNQGNTSYGIHAASTGGSWQSAVFGFGGFSVDSDEMININPWIPENWNSLKFRIKWRNNIFLFEIFKNKIYIFSDEKTEIKVKNKIYKIEKDKKNIIKI